MPMHCLRKHTRIPGAQMEGRVDPGEAASPVAPATPPSMPAWARRAASCARAVAMFMLSCCTWAPMSAMMPSNSSILPGIDSACNAEGRTPPVLGRLAGDAGALPPPLPPRGVVAAISMPPPPVPK